MYHNIFDTHSHYDDSKFNPDREELLDNLQSQGVSLVVSCGCDIDSTQFNFDLAQKYDYIYFAAGLHPENLKGANLDDLKIIEKFAKNEKCVAIGEIGLDYYWDKEGHDLQKHWFIRQLDLAREMNKPVMIHSREAAADTMEIMKEHGKGLKGVIHCYSYSLEMAREYVKMGYFIGVGGVVTFKNAKKLVKTVETIPLSSIVLETDCPYMAPEPHRGTRNDSRNIPYVIAKIAEIKGVSVEEVEQTTRENAFALFTKVPR